MFCKEQGIASVFLKVKNRGKQEKECLFLSLKIYGKLRKITEEEFL